MLFGFIFMGVIVSDVTVLKAFVDFGLDDGFEEGMDDDELLNFAFAFEEGVRLWVQSVKIIFKLINKTHFIIQYQIRLTKTKKKISRPLLELKWESPYQTSWTGSPDLDWAKMHT